MLRQKSIWMLGTLLLAPLPVFAVDTPAEEMKDPVEILKKVDSTTKAVKSIKYDVVYEGIGESKEKVADIRGKITWVGAGEPAKSKFRADLKVKRPESADVQEGTVAADGENFYVLDHTKKKAYEDIDPAVTGQWGRAARGAMMGEFGHPTPFEDEIKGKKHELKGTSKVGDEECYEIHVNYTQAGQEATWSFSKKRFIPLRRIDIFKSPDGTTRTTQRTLTNVVLDEKSDDNAFKPPVPAGYEKIDDFAP